LPARYLVGMDVKLLGQLHQRAFALDRRDRHLRLKGRCSRRALLLMLSPDSRAKSCPLSGRSSTYRPVQILEAGSDGAADNSAEGSSNQLLIPNPIDQNPWAHWRSPMDMMRQG